MTDAILDAGLEIAYSVMALGPSIRHLLLLPLLFPLPVLLLLSRLLPFFFHFLLFSLVLSSSFSSCSSQSQEAQPFLSWQGAVKSRDQDVLLRRACACCQVTIRLQETEIMWNLKMVAGAVSAESGEWQAVQQANARYLATPALPGDSCYPGPFCARACVYETGGRCR